MPQVWTILKANMSEKQTRPKPKTKIYAHSEYFFCSWTNKQYYRIKQYQKHAQLNTKAVNMSTVPNVLTHNE